MQNKPQSTLAAVLAASLIALTSGSAAAIDMGDRIEVHGYGDLRGLGSGLKFEPHSRPNFAGQEGFKLKT